MSDNSLTRVRPSMPVQVALGEEPRPAVVAGEALDAVVPLRVQLQLALLAEALAAEVAQVGLLLAVPVQRAVRGQDARLKDSYLEIHVRSCCVRTLPRTWVKRFPHSPHSKGFSPVCRLMCTVKDFFSVNLRGN